MKTILNNNPDMKTILNNNPVNAIEQYALLVPSFFKKLTANFSRLIAVLLILITASCNKMDVLAPVKDNADNQGFKSLVVTDQFNWATSQNVTIEVSPMQTDSDLLNTLYIKTLDDQNLFAYNMTMKQALLINIDLPSDLTKVKVRYGTIEKIMNIVNGRISFDFITPIPAKYE
jgi:hypothetical protein